MTSDARKLATHLPQILAAAAGTAIIAAILLHPAPEWMAYLNWQPGVASVLRMPHVALGAPFLATMLLLTLLRKTGKLHELGFVPLILAGVVWTYNHEDVARQVGYATGIAKVDCWVPGSRECLLGKFERLENLKTPKELVLLTPAEAETHKAFKAAVQRNMAARPGLVSGKLMDWAKAYKAEVDVVLKDYPSEYPKD